MKDIIFSAAVLVSCASALPAAPVRYSITDLGTLGGPIVYAFGAGDQPAAVGTSVVMPSAAFEAFLWNGTAIPLGTLPGSNQSHAFAVDALGRVFGVSYNLGEFGGHAFRWESGTMTDLGLFLPRAVNAAGQVVGVRPFVMPDGERQSRACTWSNGVLTDLPALGGANSEAMGLDASGRIVGSAFNATNLQSRPVLWANGAVTDLGTFGGANGQAYSINGSGQVVGVAETAAGMPHAFLITLSASNGVASRTDLGTLPGSDFSAAYAINESGVIVGNSDSRATLWQDGAIHDLAGLVNNLDTWRLDAAAGISSGGRIVGWGLHGDAYRAFILVPACGGDADADGTVTFADITAVLTHFNMAVAPYGAGDANGDGQVDFADITAVLASFGCGL
ncbi:MAG: hypothetical protein JNK58_08810 [Phycisphaerae bacterium]|nr:hypothetical protein [Phycisphaerae bacterium]